jgi:hypothetical protein
MICRASPVLVLTFLKIIGWEKGKIKGKNKPEGKEMDGGFGGKRTKHVWVLQIEGDKGNRICNPSD